jgi:hypothetical protein
MRASRAAEVHAGNVRSVGSLDIASPPTLVFALVTDPRHACDWSPLFDAPSCAHVITDGDHVPLRWHWRGRDELVDATIGFDVSPFRVRYEGKTDDGTRFDVAHCIVGTAFGTHVEVAVGIDSPRDGNACEQAQRDVERSVSVMTARLRELTDRLDRPSRTEPVSALPAVTVRALPPRRPAGSASARPGRRRPWLLSAVRRALP